jgi:hypothetical protein
VTHSWRVELVNSVMLGMDPNSVFLSNIVSRIYACKQAVEEAV